MGVIRFFQLLFKTRLFPSTVKRICRDLSNLYLTPHNPGKVYFTKYMYEVITSTPNMVIKLVVDQDSWTYWVNRQTLLVMDHMSEEFPLWDPRARHVLSLIRHFKGNGIGIPRNMEGVTYFKMPDEELHGKS